MGVEHRYNAHTNTDSDKKKKTRDLSGCFGCLKNVLRQVRAAAATRIINSACGQELADYCDSGLFLVPAQLRCVTRIPVGRSR